ncbi:unnamed protein product [Schistocephalus solidus]|uniref:Tektin n=1 Tax=Schistocephalus solidus TaxID=70667 RepID=A0A183TCL0_SCHSO|nr:unnamed protein product [Schistocephalus solidus]
MSGHRSSLQKPVSSSWQPFCKCLSTKSERNTNFSSGTLKEFESLRVPSIHSFAREALYTRASPAGWLSNYKNCMEKLRVEQNASERFRIISQDLANETAEQTDTTQADSKRHLENRVIDIHLGLNELECEAALNLEEWQKLDGQKRSLEKLLEKTAFQAQIAQECLYYREKRQEIDLVHDAAEKALLAVRNNLLSYLQYRCSN